MLQSKNNEVQFLDLGCIHKNLCCAFTAKCVRNAQMMVNSELQHTWVMSGYHIMDRFLVYILWFNFILALNFIFLCFCMVMVIYDNEFELKGRIIKFKPRKKSEP